MDFEMETKAKTSCYRGITLKNLARNRPEEEHQALFEQLTFAGHYTVDQ